MISFLEIPLSFFSFFWGRGYPTRHGTGYGNEYLRLLMFSGLFSLFLGGGGKGDLFPMYEYHVREGRGGGS